MLKIGLPIYRRKIYISRTNCRIELVEAAGGSDTQGEPPVKFSTLNLAKWAVHIQKCVSSFQKSIFLNFSLSQGRVLSVLSDALFIYLSVEYFRSQIGAVVFNLQ